MNSELESLITHDFSDDCPACRAQDITAYTLIPAAAAWETANELPRFSLALNGAAQLLGAMLAEGVMRKDVEEALGILLDEIETQIEEEGIMGGPPQGTA